MGTGPYRHTWVNRTVAALIPPQSDQIRSPRQTEAHCYEEDGGGRGGMEDITLRPAFPNVSQTHPRNTHMTTTYPPMSHRHLRPYTQIAQNMPVPPLPTTAHLPPVPPLPAPPLHLPKIAQLPPVPPLPTPPPTTTIHMTPRYGTAPNSTPRQPDYQHPDSYGQQLRRQPDRRDRGGPTLTPHHTLYPSPHDTYATTFYR